MKKLFYLFAVSAFVFTASCSDDDDNGGSGSDALRKISVNSSEITGLPVNQSDIYEVRAILIGIGDRVLVKTKWDNGFSLELPETLNSAYLFPVREGLDLGEEEVPWIINKVTVSSDAKTGYVDFEIFDEDGDSTEEYFSYGKIAGSEKVHVQLVYSDANCNIKGPFTVLDEEGEEIKKSTFNLSFKKGWNRMVVTTNESETIFSTSMPSGMSWYYGYIGWEN